MTHITSIPHAAQPPGPAAGACERFGTAVATFVNGLPLGDPTICWHALRLDAAVERRAQLDLRPLHGHLLYFAQLIEAQLTEEDTHLLQAILAHPLWGDAQARVRAFALGYQRERLRHSMRAVPWAWVEYDHLPPAVRELVLADALRRGVRVEV